MLCKNDKQTYHKTFNMKIIKTAMVRLVLLLSSYMSKDDKSCKSINIDALIINFFKASNMIKENTLTERHLSLKSKDTHK